MQSNDMPSISVVIACRNEEKFISNCLDSLLANQYPSRLEILVIDGQSEDRTREIVQAYHQRFPFIQLLANPQRITPIAMNIGITQARGEVIILVNAHCVVDRDFLRYSIEYLLKTGADAVGGRLNTINEDQSPVALAIPWAADSIFGAGGRRYRTGTKEGWVKDTLPYCAYRREIFDRIGLIDEELVRGQDAEFNYRILLNGGRIYFAPRIMSYLHIRPTLSKLWRQHYQYGCCKPLIARKTGFWLTCRQSIPALFVLSLLGSLGLAAFSAPWLWVFFFIVGVYLLSSLGFSLAIALRRGPKYFPILPLIFATLHFSYGTGYLMSLWNLVVLNRKRMHRDVPLTR